MDSDSEYQPYSAPGLVKFGQRMSYTFSALILALMLTVAIAGIVFINKVNDANEKELQETITSLLAECFNRTDFADNEQAKALIEQMTQGDPRIAYISILNSSGKTIASSASNPQAPPQQQPEIIQSVLSGSNPVFRTFKHRDSFYQQIAMPYNSGSKGDAGGVILVGLSMDKNHEAKVRAYFTVAGLVMLLAILSLGITLWLSNRLAGPVIDQAWKFKHILEHVPLYICTIDEKGKVIQYSDSFTRLDGLQQDDILSTSKTVFTSGKSIEKEIENSGEVKRLSFLTTAFPVCRNPQGKVALVCLFALDVTDRKKIESELHESESQLRTVIETIPDLVWVKDPEGVYITCNARFQTLFGACETEIVGKTDYDFVDRELADFFRKNDLIATSKGEPCTNEEEVTYASDGHKELLETIKTPLYDSEHKLVGVLGIARDITERKQAVENLRITLNSICDAVIATDTQGIITTINPVAQKLTGWSAVEAIGKNINEIFKVFDRKKRTPLKSPAQSVLESASKVATAEYSLLIAREGSEHIISDSAAPIRSEQGKSLGVVLVFRDMTEELTLHEQLRHSQRMDAIGQLAGGVAHDFNNMLGGIIGAAELLRKKLPQDREAHNLNDLIIDTSEKAADLTKMLLAFARKQHVATSSIDMHKAIRDGIALLSRTIDRRVKIESELHAHATDVVADRSQLQSVFINLGINAAHSMPGGGTIIIRTRNMEVNNAYRVRNCSELTDGEYIEICFCDTGCGIDKKDLPHIFEPFFTTKEHGHGTGLGLAAVYGTLKQHKGEITVSSEAGVGTTFTMMLPLDEHQSTKATPILNQTYFGKGTVLLVDDEQIMRITAKEILKELGYKVMVAGNGQEALDIYEKSMQEIDLVILDMVMPVMNGKDCFRKIIALNPQAKVILASGYSHDDDIEGMKKAGLVACIGKPYRSAALSKIVHGALKGSDA